MQSECLAASPRSISSYAWKVPPARPALFDRAQRLPVAGSEASQADHPSIPWKAYLASREFQHVSSDLAEALFTASSQELPPAAIRPASLTLSGQAPGAADGKAMSGILAPILPGGANSQAPEHGEQPDGLALAA